MKSGAQFQFRIKLQTETFKHMANSILVCTSVRGTHIPIQIRR